MNIDSTLFFYNSLDNYSSIVIILFHMLTLKKKKTKRHFSHGRGIIKQHHDVILAHVFKNIKCENINELNNKLNVND